MSTLLANTSTTSTSSPTTISIHQLECIIQKRLNIKWVNAKQLIHDALSNCEINTNTSTTSTTNIPIYRQEEIIEEAYEIYTDLSLEEQNQMKMNQTINNENDNNNSNTINSATTTATPNNNTATTNINTTSTSNINKNTTTNVATTNSSSTSSNSSTNIEPEWKRKLRIQAERRESEWYVQQLNQTKQKEIQQLLRQQQIFNDNEIPLTTIKSIRTIQNDSTNTNGIEQPKSNNDNEIPIVRIKRTTCYCIIQ